MSTAIIAALAPSLTVIVSALVVELRARRRSKLAAWERGELARQMAHLRAQVERWSHLP